MNELFNVSSNPHVRSKLTTGHVMYDVILSLLPATFMGVYNFGLRALFIILMSIASAVVTESVFDLIVHKKNTVKDGSAIVTGLLLALCLPAGVPLYIPYLGSLFAILVAKCLFGGLGKNFMNPALAGRCFLLISMSSTMNQYYLDGVSSATPLAALAQGNVVSVTDVLIGVTNGVIGNSAIALIIGGIYLLAINAITWEIPVSILASFTLFIGIFGDLGFKPLYLASQVCAGGILMAAFFMATDPVTSPVTGTGQLLYGCIIGILAGLFRVFGSAADSVSYAVVLGNLFTPLFDEYIVPKPYAYRANAMKGLDDATSLPGKRKGKGFSIPVPALVLCAITIVSGIALSGVFTLTKDAIEEQKIAKNAASYQAVLPDAEAFSSHEAMTAAIEELDGNIYGTDFGKVTINSAVEGKDASGNTVGYVINVTSGDGYDGNITLSLGIYEDGTLGGIAFTELNETAGMGMRADEDEFKDQFKGVNVESFTLNKAGGSTADDEIDSVSGASVTSSAVVNAVNAALSFKAEYAG